MTARSRVGGRTPFGRSVWVAPGGQRAAVGGRPAGAAHTTQPPARAARGGAGRPAAVELAGLGKRYGAVRALSDVSLKLGAGRFLVLLGPSGSGKSTLIRCLAGIERPSEGRIALGGVPVADGRLHVAPERRDLAMVFQDFALWPHMTVCENVRFALRRRRLTRPQARQMALAMLGRVGLGALGERYPHELSGGEQQRVALARSLVAQPQLLLFDEPLSSLDATLRERLRIEIGTLVRESGASAVYITHDQSEAFALGDEIGVLQDGRLVQRDTPERVYRCPASAFVARFTGLAGELQARVLAPSPLPGADRGTGERAPLPQPGAERGALGLAPSPLPGVERQGLVRVLLEPRAGERASEITARAPHPLRPGQGVQVLVRPAAVEIVEPDHPAAALGATVLDSAFRGRGYDHAVELSDGTLLSEIFARRPHQRGERVGLLLDPEGCHAFAAEPAVPAPRPRTAYPEEPRQEEPSMNGLTVGDRR